MFIEVEATKDIQTEDRIILKIIKDCKENLTINGVECKVSFIEEVNKNNEFRFGKGV